MAPSISDSEIQQELSIFEGIEDDPCYADFVAVASFLSDRTAVIESLKHLEQQLRVKGEALWKQSVHYRERRAFYQEERMPLSSLDGVLPGLILLHFDGVSKKDFFKHLFSSTLTDLEAHEGFAVSGYAWAPRAQYYLGVVAPDVFRQQILEGRPQGKDPFVDPGHGEYTHRLQWYAIASPTSGLRLRQPVVKVYKAIGKYVAPEGSYQSTFQWGLWDALCDRDNGTAAVVPFKAENEVDFRCPNCLNTYLRTEGIHLGLSFISAFLNGRYNKRSVPRSPFDYAAKKVFSKKNFDALGRQQQLDIQSHLSSMNAVYDPKDGWH